MPTTNGPVILIPGFLGSELSYTDGAAKGKVMWADTSTLANPDLAIGLELAADGKSPYPLIGRALVPSGPVAPYYTAWQTILVNQSFKGDFGPVQTYAWDWRRSLLDSVPGLVGLCQTLGQNSPVNLVGHSMGGLLARLVWAALVDAGQTSLVRRIITVGTPHTGAYDAPVSLCGFTSFYDGWLWSALIGWHSPWPGTGRGVVKTKGDFWSAIGGTWPGLYQLIPAPDTSTQAATMATNLLYSASSYPKAPFLIQGWFDLARNTIWPRLMDSKYTIPSAQLWTLAGSGGQVISGLGNVVVPFSQAMWDSAPRADGDGVVLLTSQLVTASQQMQAVADHSGEPTGFAANGMLAAAITAATPSTIPAKQFAPVPLLQLVRQQPYMPATLDQPLSTIQFGSYPPSRANVGDP